MSSLQSSLSLKHSKLHRFLNDNNIKISGQSLLVIRLNISEDIYGNRNYKILNASKIEGIVTIPGGEMLLFSNQRNNNDQTPLSGASIYDLTEIEGRFKFSDNIEEGDIILYPYWIAEGIPPNIQTLQVSSKLGSGGTVITKIRYILAPYTINISDYPDIEILINLFISDLYTNDNSFKTYDSQINVSPKSREYLVSLMGDKFDLVPKMSMEGDRLTIDGIPYGNHLTGPRGDASMEYTHEQLIPEKIWIIQHNLGVYPNVVVYSLGGVEVEGSVENVSLNETHITFLIALAGTARLK